MIHKLHYEPQGQRQRFEPQEQQEQNRHMHLHVHLNLTLRAGRTANPNAFPLTRIFTALLAATVMPLGIFLFVLGTASDGPPLTAWENLVWVSSCLIVVVGLALAWWTFGAVLIKVWRANPRRHLDLDLPLFQMLLIPLAVACYWFAPGFLNMLLAIPLLVVLIAHPLLTALLLRWVSREARTLRRIAPTHSKLGYFVTLGMVLMLLGELIWNLVFMLFGGNTQLIFLPAIPLAVIVAMYTLVGIFRSRGSMQAQPKDATPFDREWHRHEES